jgi:hypothetical protein
MARKRQNRPPANAAAETGDNAPIYARIRDEFAAKIAADLRAHP